MQDAEYLTLPITSSLSLVRTVRDELLKQSGLIIHNDSTDPSVGTSAICDRKCFIFGFDSDAGFAVH